MKKSWIIILVVAIIIVGIIAGLAIYNKNGKTQNNIVENEIDKVSEKITDELDFSNTHIDTLKAEKVE